MTSVWDEYPPGYRSREVQAILSAVRAGECVLVAGLSGAGKSNLMGFLYNRCSPGSPSLVFVDGNQAPAQTCEGLAQLIAQAFGAGTGPGGIWEQIETEVERRLEHSADGLCILIDRFDILSREEQARISGPLRALRDRHKYRLTCVVAARAPLDPETEIAELFFANTLWLGPLAEEDALWSAAGYARRRGTTWDEPVLRRLVELSWGYPALLRACCEAFTGGATLEIEALKAHPSVLRRVREFWVARPDPEALRLSGLDGQPLLGTSPHPQETPAVDLTASEHLLLSYFQAHLGDICSKDDLIRAVWPEDRVQDGLRDDSLAQLIRRLRQKIDPGSGETSRIETLPGRGYRYHP